jgi:GTP cyclohydrolase I
MLFSAAANLWRAGDRKMDARVKVLKPEPSRTSVPRPTREEAEDAVRTLIAWAGDDPRREGLQNTPRRVARAYEELFSGYRHEPKDALSATFKEINGYQDMVLVRDIPFYSHCEHHMLPFFGKVHIAYYPVGGVVGLSKLARLVDIYARRLQTQESLTAEVSGALEGYIGVSGVAVMVEAEHLCMSMRGVQKAGASTMTSHFTGVFKQDAAEREKFLNLVRPTSR